MTEFPWWTSFPDYGGEPEQRSAWEARPVQEPLTGAQAMIQLQRLLDQIEFEHIGDG